MFSEYVFKISIYFTLIAQLNLEKSHSECSVVTYARATRLDQAAALNTWHPRMRCSINLDSRKHHTMMEVTITPTQKSNFSLSTKRNTKECMKSEDLYCVILALILESNL